MQQVHDGAFARLEDVPRRALSLPVPFVLRVPRALVFVNGEHKSAAVRAAVQGPIAEACPASALRRHRSAILFLDAAVRAAVQGPIAEACPASALRRHRSAILFLDAAAASRL